MEWGNDVIGKVMCGVRDVWRGREHTRQEGKDEWVMVEMREKERELEGCEGVKETIGKVMWRVWQDSCE